MMDIFMDFAAAHYMMGWIDGADMAMASSAISAI
jgi:hypothetical protein